MERYLACFMLLCNFLAVGQDKRICSEIDSLIKVGDYRKAVFRSTQAIQYGGPKDCHELLYFNRAQAKSNLGDYRGSNDDLRVFLKTVESHRFTLPKDDDNKIVLLFEGLAHLTMGLNYVELRDLGNACPCFTKAGEAGEESAYEYIKEYCN